MELDTLWRIIDEGSTPAIALIAFFIWKLDKTIGELMVALKEKEKASNDRQTLRDKKLDSIHNDIGAMIRKLAGLKHE